MIIASHQIDFLPYMGFWNRVYKADIMDLSGFWDYWRKGKLPYHHRVKIGTDTKWIWLTVPIVKNISINDSNYKETRYQYDIKINQSLLVSNVWNKLKGLHCSSPYWNNYKDELYQLIVDNNHSKLWSFNLELLLWLRDKLKITTPLSFSIDKKEGTATDKIISQISVYSNNITYLCGEGGKNYLELDKINSANINMLWHHYDNPLKDYQTVSILSAMMDNDINKVIDAIHK